MQRRRSVVIDDGTPAVKVTDLPLLDEPVIIEDVEPPKASWQNIFQQAMAVAMAAKSVPVTLRFGKDGSVDVDMGGANKGACITIEPRNFPGMVLPSDQSTATLAMQERMNKCLYPTLAQQVQSK